jgi:hypothetical protein
LRIQLALLSLYVVDCGFGKSLAVREQLRILLYLMNGSKGDQESRKEQQGGRAKSHQQKPLQVLSRYQFSLRHDCDFFIKNTPCLSRKFGILFSAST